MTFAMTCIRSASLLPKLVYLLSLLILPEPADSAAGTLPMGLVRPENAHRLTYIYQMSCVMLNALIVPDQPWIGNRHTY